MTAPTLHDVIAAGALPDEASQLDLLAEDTGNFDAPSPLSSNVAAPKRGPGRPPGSRNKRQEAVVGLFLRSHRHPLFMMGEVLSMAPKDLAARIGLADADGNVTPADIRWAFGEQMDILDKVAKLLVPVPKDGVGDGPAPAVNLQINLGQTGVSALTHGPETVAEGSAGPVIEGDAAAILARWSDTP